MNERITPYLRKQLDNPAIARQYAVGAQPAEAAALFNTLDPLHEDDLLAKPTHDNVVRFAPPLVITENQLHEACDLIDEVIDAF